MMRPPLVTRPKAESKPFPKPRNRRLSTAAVGVALGHLVAGLHGTGVTDPTAELLLIVLDQAGRDREAALERATKIWPQNPAVKDFATEFAARKSAAA